jgi:hypothetical protein
LLVRAILNKPILLITGVEILMHSCINFNRAIAVLAIHRELPALHKQILDILGAIKKASE